VIILRLLGHLWMCPNTLVGLFLASFCGYLHHDGDALLFVTKPDSFITRWMRGGGFFGLVKATVGAVTVGACIIIRDDQWELWSERQSSIVWIRFIKHEQRHVWQQMVGGVFQPLAYVIGVGVAQLQGKDPYRDCFLELDARRASGES
jgi:hypothetical protein